MIRDVNEIAPKDALCREVVENRSLFQNSPTQEFFRDSRLVATLAQTKQWDTALTCNDVFLLKTGHIHVSVHSIEDRQTNHGMGLGVLGRNSIRTSNHRGPITKNCMKRRKFLTIAQAQPPLRNPFHQAEIQETPVAETQLKANAKPKPKPRSHWPCEVDRGLNIDMGQRK